MIVPRYRILRHGADYSIGVWTCHHPPREAQGEERSALHSIALPTRGVYERVFGGSRDFIDATRVAFFNAAEPYEVLHPVEGGDTSTVIELSATLVENLVSAGYEWTDTASEPHFAVRSAPLPGRLFHRHRALLHSLRKDHIDPLEVCQSVYCLIGDVLTEVGAHRAVSARRLPSARQARIERAAVFRALEFIHAHFRQPITLARIAAAAAYSPFHFLRMFQREIGVPVHRYVIRLRLRITYEEILDGPHDLSRIAFNTGFSSHSHMTESFRREFGLVPSQVRSFRH